MAWKHKPKRNTITNISSSKTNCPMKGIGYRFPRKWTQITYIDEYGIRRLTDDEQYNSINAFHVLIKSICIAVQQSITIFSLEIAK